MTANAVRTRKARAVTECQLCQTMITVGYKIVLTNLTPWPAWVHLGCHLYELKERTNPELYVPIAYRRKKPA